MSIRLKLAQWIAPRGFVVRKWNATILRGDVREAQQVMTEKLVEQFYGMGTNPAKTWQDLRRQLVKDELDGQ